MRPSFWRRLLWAIMEGRQRKADEFLRAYLEHHVERVHPAQEAQDAVLLIVHMQKGQPMPSPSNPHAC
jgi:hypothetical protein